jgi:ABC-2 type transport system ATP-binding protein
MELVINNLKKQYPGGVKALKGINLNISNGMFGLLGPNGAGKSTLMKIIATLQEPDSGTIFLDSLDVINDKQETRKRLGYLPQEFGVYPDLSALEMLNHIAILKGISNKKERQEAISILLDRTNLYAARKKKLGGYSGGMKQRFGIAQAMLAKPDLIIVDEPTAGLDPEERHRFHNLLTEIGEERIVILSTHIVDDVRELCSQMAILYKGTLLQNGNPEGLINDVKGTIWQKVIEKSEARFYEESFDVISTRLFMGKIKIHVFLDTNPGDGFSPVKADLEDLYFYSILQQAKNIAATQVGE